MRNEGSIEIPCQGATILIPRDTILRNFISAMHADLDAPEQRTAEAMFHQYTSTPPALGQYWEGKGGIYAGLMRGEGGHPNYHLIVSNSPAGYAAELAWGSQGKDEPAATSSWDGHANTLALTASGHNHPVADWVKNLDIDGHTDWYIPSRREASLCAATCPEIFEPGYHWTSTQYSAYHAFIQAFDAGVQGYDGKASRRRVRAVRRFVAN